MFVVSKSQRRELELLIHRLVDAARTAATTKNEDYKMIATDRMVQAQLAVSEKLDEIEWDYQDPEF
jgi:hypothetical protein